MKRILNKTTMAIILAVTMLFAVLGGLLLIRNTDSADAEAATTTVTFEAPKSCFAGSKVTLKIIVTSTRSSSSEYFNTINLNIGPVADNGTEYDYAKCKQLTFSSFKSDPDLDPDYFTTSKGTVIYTDTSVANKAAGDTEAGYKQFGNMLLGASKADTFNLTTATFTVDITISAEAGLGTEFKIGLTNTTSSYVSYSAQGSPKSTRDTPVSGLNVTPATITIKEPSDVNDLSSLKVSQDEVGKEQGTDLLAGKDDSAAKDSFETDLTIEDLSKDLNVYFETAEDSGATVKVGKKGELKEAESGKSTSVQLEDLLDENGEGDLVIEVTSETGDPKEYTVHISTVAADFESIIATTEDSDLGDSKVKAKLVNAFSAGTSESNLTVNVPTDAKKVQLTLTTTGYNLKDDITLTPTGCTPDGGNTAKSGTAFTVTVAAEGDTLKIKATAEKGITTSEKEYTLTFHLVDTDATLDNIEVKGQSNDKKFDPIDAKPEDKDYLDYYFKVVDPESNGQAKVTITATSTKAKIMINIDGDSNYSSTNTKTATAVKPGEYTITIQAEAENTKTYKIMLESYVPLHFDSQKESQGTLKAAFILEESNQRFSYAQKEMTHGVDDLDFDRVVIGNISPMTTPNEFLENFDEATAKQLQIYNSTKTLIMDLNKVDKTDGETDIDNPDDCSVGTGWYIKYYVGGKLSETVYLSVLGDLDGDGHHGGGDISTMGRMIKGVVRFDTLNVEVKLAAYLTNVPEGISNEEITILSALIDEEYTSDTLFEVED